VSKLGAYNQGGTIVGDTAWSNMVDSQQAVASTYYQANKTGPGPQEADRVSKGIIPNLSVATKNLNGCATCYMLWADIAAGKYDAFWTGWGSSLAALNAPVWFTFDQEPEVRLNQGTVPIQKLSDYAAAYRRIHALIAPLAGNVVWTYWVGGSDTAKITAMYPGDAYVGRIGWDPYKWASHPASETALQTFKPFADWLNAQSWGKGKPRYLSETGVDIGVFGEQNAADWWAGVPAAARQVGVTHVIAFNSRQWVIDAYPKVVAAVGNFAAG
jgi:hypothetical protein